MSDLIAWHAPWSGRLLVLLVVLLGLAAVGWSYRRPSAARDRCRRCRYDLRGSSAERCPECGHRRGAWTVRALRPERGIIFAIGLLLAIGLPGFVAGRRMREFGWNYYLRLEPLYSLDRFETIDSWRVGGVAFWSERDRRVDLTPARLLVKDADGTRLLLGEGSTLSDEWERFVTVRPLRGPQGRIYACVEGFSGGAHCCTTNWIMAVADGRAALAATLATGNSGLAIRDLDGDCVDELECGDDVFAYWRTSYASSPHQAVRLRLEDDRIVLAEDLMRSEVPGPEERLAALRTAFGTTVPTSDVPPAVWSLALAWIYAGHGAEAIATLHDGWPAERRDRDEFLADFLATFAHSQWSADLRRMGGPSFDAAVAAAAGPAKE